MSKKADKISEALLSGLSKEQLQQWRKDRLNEAIYKKGVNGKKVLRTYAKEHNEQLNATKQAIHQAERLTKHQLDELTKNATSSMFSARDLIDFTLGKTTKNQTISPELLGLYLSNIATYKSKFLGGISMQDVIYLSLDIDIKRANEQIFMAQLFKRDGDVFYFITNSGVHQQYPNHKVIVQLVEYEGLITGASKVPSHYAMGEFLKHKKIKFDCDCGRHGYWYRYLATIGKYNYGIDENRYPSTRNPNLRGVACKHVLRVVKMLQSEQGIQLLKKAIMEDMQKGYNVGSLRIDKAQIAKKAIIDSDPRRVNHHKRQLKKKITTQLKAAFFEYEKDKKASLRRDKNANERIAMLTKSGLVLSKEHKTSSTNP